ncbi:DMT family transporter [Acinetobacter soli]|uniref:DMT family transporter n=1 Tax=Acinetobacter soli TaxID=487316 RepID=A0AB38YZY5_9GAMM|nr:DMT family transporter [Acinetobacter soli]KQD01653.1 transporter [Acinetobacter soli]MBO3639137.1 DMT family transporter [Acinetobacter soli]MDQ8941619.1 DMT family transporter [Acinetobacter soli]WEI00486.1 DMT family transporter [Acinetobacter soli]WND06711.1 DMT family transporter [Acinetobacter soli]
MAISIYSPLGVQKYPVKLYACIALTVLCWGYSPIGVHSALMAYRPEQIALLRFILASLFLLVLVAKKGIQPLKIKDLSALGILGIFSVTLHHLLINAGQQYVSAVASSILSQSIPLFTLLISAFVLKQRIQLKQWGCILLGLVGAVLVITADRGVEPPSLYSLFIVLAAVAWAIYFNLYKKFALNYDVLSMMCYVIWLGTLPLLLFSPHLPQAVMDASWQANLSIVLLGIFPSALAHVLWGSVLKTLPLTQASSFLYCTPLVAIVLGLIMTGERPSLGVLIGGAVIIMSLIIMNYIKK